MNPKPQIYNIVTYIAPSSDVGQQKTVYFRDGDTYKMLPSDEARRLLRREMAWQAECCAIDNVIRSVG